MRAIRNRLERLEQAQAARNVATVDDAHQTLLDRLSDIHGRTEPERIAELQSDPTFATRTMQRFDAHVEAMRHAS